MPEELRKTIKEELISRGYDKFPADEQLFEELVDDLEDAIIKWVGDNIDQIQDSGDSQQ